MNWWNFSQFSCFNFDLINVSAQYTFICIKEIKKFRKVFLWYRNEINFLSVVPIQIMWKKYQFWSPIPAEILIDCYIFQLHLNYVTKNAWNEIKILVSKMKNFAQDIWWIDILFKRKKNWRRVERLILKHYGHGMHHKFVRMW